LREVFAKLDADGDSQISPDDLTSALKETGFGGFGMSWATYSAK
jgi:Ca2+-binding EF-hand superfamily protein